MIGPIGAAMILWCDRAGISKASRHQALVPSQRRKRRFLAPGLESWRLDCYARSTLVNWLEGAGVEGSGRADRDWPSFDCPAVTVARHGVDVAATRSSRRHRRLRSCDFVVSLPCGPAGGGCLLCCGQPSWLVREHGHPHMSGRPETSWTNWISMADVRM